MRLLNKQNRESTCSGSQAVIASGAFIEGNLKLTCNIHIDGQVKGDIETDRVVMISGTGSVDGSVRAERIVVNGRFSGSIYSKSIEILENGHIEGEVLSSEFTIQKGGVFLGRSKNIKRDEVIELAPTVNAKKELAKEKPKKVEQCA